MNMPGSRIGPHWHQAVHGDLEICVVPLLFGRARVTLGAAGDDGWDEAWEFDDPVLAITEAEAWRPGGPAPKGWIRHIPRKGPAEYAEEATKPQ